MEFQGQENAGYIGHNFITLYRNCTLSLEVKYLPVILFL